MIEITKTARQEAHDQRFAALSAGRTVATITGTDKQIAWATDIRARLVADMYEAFRVPGAEYTDGTFADDEFIVDIAQLDAALRILMRIGNAAWWINQRHNGNGVMWRLACDLAAKNAKAAAK